MRKDEIDSILSVLVGTNFYSYGRAGDMAMFTFHRNSGGPSTGDAVEFPDDCFHLHIQCPWRLILHDKIITGYEDYFIDPNTYDGLKNLDANSLCDAQMKHWMDLIKKDGGVIVHARSLDNLGSISIGFSSQAELSVFPTSCCPDESTEAWRLFGNDGDPLVVV